MDEFYAPMGGIVDRGYATFTTDGGLANPYPPENWVLKRPGVLDHLNLENWGTVSLNDMVSYTSTFRLSRGHSLMVIQRPKLEKMWSRSTMANQQNTLTLLVVHQAAVKVTRLLNRFQMLLMVSQQLHQLFVYTSFL
jgi:hypothetical protein